MNPVGSINSSGFSSRSRCRGRTTARGDAKRTRGQVRGGTESSAGFSRLTRRKHTGRTSNSSSTHENSRLSSTKKVTMASQAGSGQNSLCACRPTLGMTDGEPRELKHSGAEAPRPGTPKHHRPPPSAISGSSSVTFDACPSCIVHGAVLDAHAKLSRGFQTA